MSQQAFQSDLVRLIIDPDFRELVRAGTEAVLSPDLTNRERERLRLVAADPGMNVNRTLHKGFRLGKLRALLPMTCTVLGTQRLAEELAVFWREELPSSFYFLPEALCFCLYLQNRIATGMTVEYLDEVVAYEQAVLELQRVRPEEEKAEPRMIVFRHDPMALLTELAKGWVPPNVRRRNYLLTVDSKPGGGLEWRLSDLEGS
jgi:hypothetical protein